MSTAPVRMGVIGAGAITTSHFEAMAASPRAEVIGIADLNLALAEERAANFGGEAFTDYRDVLALKPDAVLIATPPNLHPEHAAACYEAGVHVLCEKPLALTVEECDEMIAGAKKAGVQLMCGQVLRYYPGPMTLIKVAKSGRLGDIVSCWSTRVGYYPSDAGPAWRMDPKIGGGTALEWEVHEIDLLRMIAGEVKSVAGRAAYTRTDAPGFDDHVHAVFEMDGGAIGRIDASNSSYYDECTRGVIGTKGAAWCGWESYVSVRVEGSSEVERVDADLTGVPEGVNAGMYLQDEGFLTAIQEGTPVPVPGEEGRADVAIARAILDSSAQGRTLAL